MNVFRTVLCFLFLCLFYFLNAQEPDTTVKDRDMIDVPVFRKYNSVNEDKINNKEKIKVNIEMGTSYTSVSGNSFMSYYSMPSTTFSINPKFDLTTGVLINRSNYPYLTINSSEEAEVDYSPVTDVIVFTNGVYRYNNKLTISGGAYKNINDVAPKAKPYTSLSQSNHNIQGMSFGINYMVTENFRIGFDFSYSEGFGLYNSYPDYYYTPGMNYFIPGLRYNPYFGF